EAAKKVEHHAPARAAVATHAVSTNPAGNLRAVPDPRGHAYGLRSSSTPRVTTPGRSNSHAVASHGAQRAQPTHPVTARRTGWAARAGARDRERVVAEGGRGRLQRLAGDGAPLVASLAGGGRGGAAHTVLPSRSLESSAPLARQLAPELAETICACRRETGW